MTQVLPDEVKNRRSGPRPPDGRSEHPEATVRLLSQDRSRNCLRFMGIAATLDPHGWLVERPRRIGPRSVAAENRQSFVLDRPGSGK